MVCCLPLALLALLASGEITASRAKPQVRFWIASDSENTSRGQPKSVDIGSSRMPKIERAPKPRPRMIAPATMMTVVWFRRCMEAPSRGTFDGPRAQVKY